jgi:hypothetical protein
MGGSTMKGDVLDIYGSRFVVIAAYEFDGPADVQPSFSGWSTPLTLSCEGNDVERCSD